MQLNTTLFQRDRRQDLDCSLGEKLTVMMDNDTKKTFNIGSMPLTIESPKDAYVRLEGFSEGDIFYKKNVLIVGDQFPIQIHDNMKAFGFRLSGVFGRFFGVHEPAADDSFVFTQPQSRLGFEYYPYHYEVSKIEKHQRKDYPKALELITVQGEVIAYTQGKGSWEIPGLMKSADAYTKVVFTSQQNYETHQLAGLVMLCDSAEYWATMED